MMQLTDCRRLVLSVLLACGAALAQQPNLDELQKKLDEAKKAQEQKKRDAAKTPKTAPASSAASAVAGAQESFVYFLQAGAFVSPDDAELQRARLSLLGIASDVSVREHDGRKVFRVRTGPFPSEEAARASQTKLSNASIDAALVRVQK